MSRQRPVLRVAVLGIVTAIAGFAVIAVHLGWQVRGYQVARHRAVAVVDGTVVEDGIGDSGDIRVRWIEHAGGEHVQRFRIDNTDRYRQGRVFAVAYDPTDPTPAGFPADPQESAAEEDLIVPIWLTGAATVVIIGWWVLRGLRFRRSAGLPGRPVAATVLAGERANGAWAFLGVSTWIALAASDGVINLRRPDRWQRVMWHPVVDTLPGRVDTLVHGDLSSGRRVVVEMSDGTRLVPVGRLRHRPPKRMILNEHADVRVSVADSFILPQDAPASPAHRWWRWGMVLALVGAAVGAAMNLLFGGGADGGVAIVPFAVGISALLVNGWALAGTEP
ncbi:hypothetical protein [Frankia sp. Cppng1_Ct_nod]|uniref:hypothetical protein n=1 Tax=Frankia sp. Cppng1_Ct_nod TaxID=2897162 RepID=UPI00104149F7|nr:hypothetical protein [Frankia sp. Cppng1_Ct_nod]